jgi:hypothetical protein
MARGSLLGTGVIVDVPPPVVKDAARFGACWSTPANPAGAIRADEPRMAADQAVQSSALFSFALALRHARLAGDQGLIERVNRTVSRVASAPVTGVVGRAASGVGRRREYGTIVGSAGPVRSTATSRGGYDEHDDQQQRAHEVSPRLRRMRIQRSSGRCAASRGVPVGRRACLRRLPARQAGPALLSGAARAAEKVHSHANDWRRCGTGASGHCL